MTVVETARQTTVAPVTVEEAPILISESAATRLLSMQQEKGLNSYGLRVFVSGGGCSGLQYGMTFDDEIREGTDVVFHAHGLKVIIDPISIRYMQGSTIDYQTSNLLEGAFKIDNPNAVSSCGCGSSFRPKDGEAGETHAHGGGGCSSCSSH